MSYWRRRFGVALQKANAQVILMKLDGLTDCSSTVFNKANPFDFCSQLCVHYKLLEIIVCCTSESDILN